MVANDAETALALLKLRSLLTVRYNCGTGTVWSSFVWLSTATVFDGRRAGAM